MKISNIPKAIKYCRKANVPLLLWGTTGCGKTFEVIRSLEENDQLVLLHLGQQYDGDLIGYPIGNKEDGKMHWLPPCWWPEEGTSGIVFLDEINRYTSRDVLQGVFELCTPKWDPKYKRVVYRLHEHVLPEGWYVVAAANPESEDYMVNPLDVAMKSRFVQVKINIHDEETAEWVLKNYKDDMAKTFFSKEPSVLNNDKPFELEILTSRRAGTYADAIISEFDFNDKDWHEIGIELLKGVLPTDIVALFIGEIEETLKNRITLKELLAVDDFVKFYKEKIDILFDKEEKRVELIQLVLQELVQHKTKLSEKELQNVYKFFKCCPIDMVEHCLANTYNTNSILSDQLLGLLEYDREFGLMIIKASGCEGVDEVKKQLEKKGLLKKK